ncbi:FxSxx-COOH system tetratricopeptide repeat protein [Actinoplanes solisilvae]|uniref:FxSxx-COOH system tetratricopeptide repeat protein n=1 Tax=Actinoplanes solisilvae TaxID=2486853 RepID=UPI000FDCD4F1|nr:FxSxx-COOH system tetratricopeptide repeat protein [Actinoplanes solisilvae]
MSEPTRPTAEAGRDALARALTAISPDRLEAVARDVFGFVPLPADFRWDDPHAVVARIASLPASQLGAPSLVRYAVRLSQEVGQPASVRISRLADAMGQSAGMSDSELRNLYAVSRALQPNPVITATAPGYDQANRLKTGTERSEDLLTRDTIADLPKASLERSEAVRIWGGVPLRNPDFTGREVQLLTLQRSLESRSKASVLPHALHGFGGVGKTQLAVEFAYRFADRYDLAWWIPAEQPSLVLQSLADLATQLGIPVTQDLSQTASLVIDALSSTSLRWLLVYDNANDPDDLAHLIPSAGGHVVLTSRNQTWSDVWDAIEVNIFERRESIALIQKRGTNVTHDDANRLADKLGDLPLALDQAASWQTATKMPVSEYLSLFDQHYQVLLAEGKPTGYPRTIAALVKLAYQRLQRDSPAVAQLVAMFAMLGAEPISLRVLRRGRFAEIAPPLGPMLRDSIALGRVVRDVRKFGLAKLDVNDRIQMHRLFQLVLRDELGTDQLEQSRHHVQRMLAAANPGTPDDDGAHAVYAELAPHVLPSGLIDADEEEALKVVLDQIRYLFSSGDYEASRRLGDSVVAAWTARADHPSLGPNGELTLLANRHLSAALMYLGSNDRARDLAETALRRLRENPRFGPDHEHSLYTANTVGGVLRVAGEFKEALQNDRDNVERHRRVYGDDHSETLKNEGNLAVNLRMLSDFQGAYDIDSEIVRKYEETLTEQERPLLFAQANLARDLYGLGRYADALSLEDRILPIYRRIAGDKHPEVLLAERTRAMAMRKTGRYADALRVARRHYHDMTSRYGDSHQHSLAATMTYANSLRVTGEFNEARGLALDALNRYRSVFGDKHPLTLTTMVNTAIVMRALNDENARDLDEAAHATMEATLGPVHGYTLCAASGLANDYVLAGELDRARQLSSKTLAASRSARGEKHHYTLLCAINAGFDLVAVNESEEGERELSDGIRLLSDLLSPSHPEALDARRGRRAECDIEPPPT